MAASVGMLPCDVYHRGRKFYPVIGSGSSIIYLKGLLEGEEKGRLPEGVRGHIFGNLNNIIGILERDCGTGIFSSEELGIIIFAREHALNVGDIARSGEESLENLRQENLALRQIYREYRELIEDVERGLPLTSEQEKRKRSLIALIGLIDTCEENEAYDRYMSGETDDD